MKRRSLLFFLITSGISPAFPAFGKTKSKNPYDERRLLEQNKRIQRENNAPEEFPSFIREGLFTHEGLCRWERPCVVPKFKTSVVRHPFPSFDTTILYNVIVTLQILFQVLQLK